MTEDIYQQLANHLDDMPGGFPSTESGVELRILRRLFTPEEARLALSLTYFPEEPARVAGRVHLSEVETARRLEEMAKKGLIYRIQEKEGPVRYMACQFVIGIWEFHVNSLDLGLIKDMEEYIPCLLNPEIWKKVPQLRTIPVGRSLPVEPRVMPYEIAEEMVRSHQRILVAPCICRRERRMVGEGCARPEETCLVFGSAADYYLKNGLGRMIDQEEALEILKTADKEGLILQPSNSQRIVNICCCCGCCCGVLRTIKRHPQPASFISSAYRAAHDAQTCEVCGTCLERCQMDALRRDDGAIILDLSRCIGCGLCVSTCPTKSLALVRKPSPEQPDVPETMMKTYMKLSRSRKKLKPTRVVRAWLKSRL